MLVSEAIDMIRARINDEYDTGYSDEVLINYINDAIKYLSHALIARNDPLLAKNLDVDVLLTNTVPSDFVRFAGGYPVRKLGNTFYITDTSPIVHTKYFFIPAEMASTTDTLPFDSDTFHMVIINLACIYALNQHEFNVERDTALRQELETIITQALGAIE